jgi:hypothetical protein
VINGELLASTQPRKATVASAHGSIAQARAGASTTPADLPVTGTAAALLIALGAAVEARGRGRLTR